jgi:hypothetical protein
LLLNSEVLDKEAWQLPLNPILKSIFRKRNRQVPARWCYLEPLVI